MDADSAENAQMPQKQSRQRSFEKAMPLFVVSAKSAQSANSAFLHPPGKDTSKPLATRHHR